MNVKLIAIAALGKNRQIGLRGALPWDMPEDYAHYKNTVKGKYVLIGRKNFEHHGYKVEGSIPLVITRDKAYKHKDVLRFTSIADALAFLEESEVETAYVIGGAKIYELALPYVSEFLWSDIDYDGPADRFFPDFSSFQWTKLSEEEHKGWRLNRLLKIPQRA